MNTEFICKVGSQEQGRVVVTDHIQTVDHTTYKQITNISRGEWTVDLLSPKHECVTRVFKVKAWVPGAPTNKVWPLILVCQLKTQVTVVSREDKRDEGIQRSPSLFSGHSQELWG